MEKNELKALLLDAFSHWEENTFSLFGLEDGPIWDPPLIGFARGDDPMFQELKQSIDPSHMTPAEAWAAACPGDAQEPDGLTVVSMALPHASAVMEGQGAARGLPDIRWVYARNSWNAIVKPLYAGLLAGLARHGVAAVAPDQRPGFSVVMSERGYYSNWSQRHVAHIAGLGTFGLSEGFITERGVAVRIVSLVLKGAWPADARRYASYNEWCLFGRDGGCGVCAVRCPAGAITKAGGHDKAKCKAYLAVCASRFTGLPGVDPAVETGCGLCQAGVPCARTNPAAG